MPTLVWCDSQLTSTPMSPKHHILYYGGMSVSGPDFKYLRKWDMTLMTPFQKNHGYIRYMCQHHGKGVH